MKFPETKKIVEDRLDMVKALLETNKFCDGDEEKINIVVHYVQEALVSVAEESVLETAEMIANAYNMNPLHLRMMRPNLRHEWSKIIE